MDQEELSKKLRADDSGAWPDAVRGARITPTPMPADLRSRLNALVEREPQPARRHSFVLASGLAAVGLVAFGSLLWIFLGPAPAADVLAVRGEVRHAGKAVSKGAAVRLSDPLVLGATGRVTLGLPQWAHGGILLSGPGEFRVVATSPLEVKVERGHVAIWSKDASKSGQDSGPAWIVQTSRATYRPVGTEVILDVQPDREQLVVGAGSVVARRGAERVRVPAGNALELSAPGVPLVPKPAGALVAAVARSSRDIREVIAGRPVLDAEVSLETSAAIRAHYGTLHRVRMVDGRSYVGYAAVGPKQVRVHVTYGVIQIPRAQVASTEVVGTAGP